jgi:hypothetical protein
VRSSRSCPRSSTWRAGSLWDAHLPLVVLAGAIAAAIGAVSVWRTARLAGAPASASFWFLLAFPTAVFQLALYTEGFFLAFSALCLEHTLRRRTGAAAAFGALAGLCRPQGVLLVVPMALAFAMPLLRRLLLRRHGGLEEARDGDWRPMLLRSLAAMAPGAGFVVMAAVSYRVAGSPLAFLTIQSSWGRSYAAGGIADAILGALAYEGPRFDLLGLLLGLGVLPVMWRRLPLPLAAYGTAMVLMPLLTGSILSIGRFMSVSVPHVLALALAFDRMRVARYALLAGMVVLQVVIASGVVAWQFMG